MAFHCRMTLPTLKVTKHTPGKKVKSIVFRGTYDGNDESHGLVEMEQPSEVEQQYESSMDVTDSSRTEQSNEGSPPDEPTLHELQRKADVRGWEQLRSSFLSAFTECSAMPSNQLCIICHQSAAQFRCQECGPAVFYCHSCFCLKHEYMNHFHVAEKWEGGKYVTADVHLRRMNVLPLHTCDTIRTVLLLCLDEHGVEHSIHFTCCSCEPLAVTLIRAKLWPATPHYPKYAYSFKLLDLAESLLLECQVALKDFCQALQFLCPYSIKEQRDVYTTLINAFEEYRFFKYEQRHLCYLSDTLDRGNVCPACPKADGKVVYSADALFGLPRKKAAGTSHRSPFHGHLFFSDQASVDEFVTEASSLKSLSKDCNNFLAGDAMRSSTRYHALDETALFGASCRHEFPTLFFNLKHGERLSYAVYLVEKLLDKHHDTEVYVMYDVACTLTKYLKHSRREDILKRINLCLPSFHSYGHKATCQIVFSPLRCSGVGLSDGEVMERLWSYLRRFSRMTKEMRPAHRVDILAHALLYYGMKKKKRLSHQLMLRWQRAQELKHVAEEEFSSLVNSLNGTTVSEEVIKKWIQEETMTVTDTASSLSLLPQWKCEYYLNLHYHHQLKDKLSSGVLESEEKRAVYHELVRMNTVLKEFEVKHNLQCRWESGSRDYSEVKKALSSERRNDIGEALWAASSRQQYLLRTKVKYADGHKIAKKLSIQIAKETKKIKELLPEFNVCQSVVDESGPITLEEASDPVKLTATLHGNFSHSKREIIDAFFRMKRAEEEVSMLSMEMTCVTEHYECEVEHVQKSIQTYSSKPESAFNRGAIALLQKLLGNLQLYLKQSKDAYQSFEDSGSDSDEEV